MNTKTAREGFPAMLHHKFSTQEFFSPVIFLLEVYFAGSWEAWEGLWVGHMNWLWRVETDVELLNMSRQILSDRKKWSMNIKAQIDQEFV